MKRRIVQMMLMIALALLPLGVSAQSSVVTGSGFQVQNLSETQTATIVVTYYNANGTTAATQTQTIPAGGSLTFFDGNGGTVAMAAPAGFRGSVVISSDQPIAAITNLIGTGLGEAYSGFSAGAQTVSVPLIMRGNAGFSTSLTIQNVGSASTTVNVAYTPGTSGTAGTDSATIPAGSSVTFDQSTNTALGTTFIGSATVTAGAGGSIVAIVNQTAGAQLLTYNGFTGGAPSIAVPLVMANNSGFYTGIQVQNAGAASTNVTVAYSANSATGSNACGTPTASTFALAAGASKTLIQAGGDAASGFNPFFATCTYIGSATITSDNSTNLVAIANELGGSLASSYESFSTAAATNKVTAPLVVANNGGLSGVQVQNVGAAAADVTITYSANSATGTGVCGTPTARTTSIAAGASQTFQLAGSSGGFDPATGQDGQFATCRYVGSATITTAAGGKLVAVVNQIATGLTDGLFTYNGFNQ